MTSKTHRNPKYRIRIVITVCSSVILILLSLVMFVIIKDERSQQYMGLPAKVIAPDQQDAFQIYQAILNAPPKLALDVQANITITIFTKDASQESVTYNNKNYSSRKYLTVKEGDKWIIIEQTSGSALPLPNNSIANKYKLPLGWYSNT